MVKILSFNITLLLVIVQNDFNGTTELYDTSVEIFISNDQISTYIIFKIYIMYF